MERCARDRSRHLGGPGRIIFPGGRVRPLVMDTPISIEPAVVRRARQPYVGVRQTVTMATIPQAADQIPVIMGRLDRLKVTPAGPAFLRYHVIEMDGLLEIEAGVPVARTATATAVALGTPADGGVPVAAGLIPAGRYVTSVHTGPYDELAGVIGRLLAWASGQGLRWDLSTGP